jgi:hypothetical protein
VIEGAYGLEEFRDEAVFFDGSMESRSGRGSVASLMILVQLGRKTVADQLGIYP